MKSLIFMMMLTMAAISAGVVYLSINREPLGGVPHVDVTLDPPPQEEAKAEPSNDPADTTAVAPAASDVAAPTDVAAPAEADPLIASPTGALATDPASTPSIELPPEGDSGEPLTTTAFPIPETDAATDPAATTGDPAAVDQ